MNPYILIVTLFFLIPLIKGIKKFIIVNFYSEIINGIILEVKKEEVYTRSLQILLNSGKNIKLIVMYAFKKNNIEFKNTEELLLIPSSKFNKLKKGDSISLYINISKSKIINTWIEKPKIKWLMVNLFMVLILLLIGYLSRKM